MNYKLLLFPLILGYGTPVLASDNSSRMIKAPQVAAYFEDIDINGDEMLDETEVRDAYAVLFDTKYKNPPPTLGSISFGGESSSQKPPKVKREYSRSDFIESNTLRLFYNDKDSNSMLSTSEYQVRKEYSYSKEECKEVLSEIENKPKTFSAISDAILNGDSHKKYFCETKR